MKENEENIMKLTNKLAIFLVAVLITFVGFSLIASSSVEILKVGKKAGYEMISNMLANEANAAASQSSSV
jgi:hypothetical protein